MSRHRSTSTIITIRRRRREETHKIIRDNQFNGIHYRPRYNKSTITIPQNQKKKRKEKKKKKKGAKIYPRRKKSRVTLIRSTGLVSIIEDNDRISRAYIESRRSAIPIGFNLITTLLLCPFVTEEDNTSSNYGVDLADEDARFEDAESLSYNGQTHRSLALS